MAIPRQRGGTIFVAADGRGTNAVDGPVYSNVICHGLYHLQRLLSTAFVVATDCPPPPKSSLEQWVQD